MKKLILLLAGIILCCGNALAWGRYGHSTIAYIAEQNLSPKAKKAINEYLHGSTLVSVSSLNDTFKNRMLVDMGEGYTDPRENGFHTLPHTFESDMNFEPCRVINDNGRYVKNAMWWVERYSKDLKENAKEMDDSTRFAEITTIVHLMGDMHCPEHIRYNPEDMTIGYYPVVFRKENIRYHTLWDDALLTYCYNWGFSDLAYIIDHFDKKQMKQWTEGDVWNWASDAARECWGVHQFKEGDVLDKNFHWQNWALIEKQIAKAGHRLAKVLNETFK